MGDHDSWESAGKEWEAGGGQSTVKQIYLQEADKCCKTRSVPYHYASDMVQVAHGLLYKC